MGSQKMAMPHNIDQEIREKAIFCEFDQQCLKDFDTSLCCEIIDRQINSLLVKPVSTFKLGNCQFLQITKQDVKDVHICTCPVRLEIYDNEGK